jgi:hypothetical protein
MTDSIKSILDLSRLPKAGLENIPVEKTWRARPKQPGSIIPFDAWMTIVSPLTRNGMKVKVITDRDLTPTALVAEFNIPNATVGQNAELGHSVYAANTVALNLLKIFLAQHGVPHNSLEMLGVEDMKAGSVTITYLIPAPDGRTVQSIIEAIGHRFQQFFPLSNDARYGGSVVGSKDSLTAYAERRGWGIRVYSTPAHKIEGDENVPSHNDRVQFARRVVRIELTLTAETLRKHNLQAVSGWRLAHENGIYKTLFDEYIRNDGLRLNEKLRTDKPADSDLLKLSDTNRHVVVGYIAGKPIGDCNALKRTSKLASQKAKSAAARAILKLLRIDIDIGWVEHHKLGNTWMDKVIVYAGDHHPPAERVASSFCQENLPAIQQQLRIALDRAISLATGGGHDNSGTCSVDE